MSQLRTFRSLRLAFAAAAAAVAASPLAAQAPVPTKPYESASYRYVVNLPTGCRHDEGPGTIDAVCSADLDGDKSASASAAHSLVLEVTAERLAQPDAPQPAATYQESDFIAELPESVCGTQDRTRVKISQVEQVSEVGKVTFSALVTCPEMKFMGLSERQASVRYVFTPAVRYRLFARAPQEQYDRSRPIIDAFLASFRPTS